jgi:hypothetical protein
MLQHAATRLIGPFGLLLLAACSQQTAMDNRPGAKASDGGTLVVSWQAPTQNTDGSPLTDLSGYTIRYGTEPGVYTQTMPVDDPTATHAVIHGLKPGTRYFVTIAANNKAGAESAPATGSK